jgi:hypothetical protein
MAEKRRSVTGDTHVSKKRKAITFKMKLDIIRRSEKVETPSQIGQLLGLNRSTIGTIIKDKAIILEHVKRSAHTQSTIITKRSGIILDIEK